MCVDLFSGIYRISLHKYLTLSTTQLPTSHFTILNTCTVVPTYSYILPCTHHTQFTPPHTQNCSDRLPYLDKIVDKSHEWR